MKRKNRYLKPKGYQYYETEETVTHAIKPKGKNSGGKAITFKVFRQVVEPRGKDYNAIKRERAMQARMEAEGQVQVKDK